MAIITIEEGFATYRVRYRTTRDDKCWWIVERWSRNAQRWEYQGKFKSRDGAVAYAEQKLNKEAKHDK